MKPKLPEEDTRKAGVVEHWCAACGCDQASFGFGYPLTGALGKPGVADVWYHSDCIPKELRDGKALDPR